MRLLSSLLLLLWLPLMASANDQRPNVLFLAVDDLRPELRCYGKQHIHSPNIDRLAASGVLFERAYCMVPTCGASRACLMTGIRPSRNRFINYLTWAERDAPGKTTMNTRFKAAGYHTLSLGKIFHHPKDNAEGWSKPAWRPRGVPWYQDPANRKLHDQRQGEQGSRKRGPAWESADVEDDAYADGVLAEKAVEVLGQLKRRQKPFFLAVGFFKPHLPFVAPKKYWDLYDHQKISLPDNYRPPKNAPKQSLHTSGELRAYAGIPAKGPVSDETARNLIHGYYACVSYTDAMIGKILDELKRLELDSNTIVVLWGDHGWNLGEHTLWCKHSCYETSMHIPLIIRGPTVHPGRRVSALVESIDLYPTLCAMSEIDSPEHLQGRSLTPLLKDPAADWKSSAIGRYRNGDTIKTSAFRFTEYTDAMGRRQAQMLYDHESDSAENENVAAGHAAAVDQLRKELQRRMGRNLK